MARCSINQYLSHLWTAATMTACVAILCALPTASSHSANLASGPLGSVFQVCALEHDQVESAVAYNAKREEYLVVWTNDWPGNDDLYAQRIASSGELIGGWFAVTFGPGVERRNPSVAYNYWQDEYLVVWEHDDGSGPEIRGRRIAGSGLPLASEIAISTDAAALASRIRPSVAYALSADKYLVVWERHPNGVAWSDIEAQELSKLGAPEGNSFIVAQGTASKLNERPDLAFNVASSHYLVVWQRPVGSQMDVYGRRVRALGGASVLGSEFAVVDWAYHDSDPAVASLPFPEGEGQYQVIFRTVIDGAGDILGQRISDQGTIVGSKHNVGGPHTPPGDKPDLRSPAIAADPPSNQYLAVWRWSQPLIAQTYIEAQLMDPYGNHLGDKATIGGEVAMRPAVAPGPQGDYLVTFDDRPPLAANRDVYARLWGALPPTPTPSPTSSPTMEPEPSVTPTVPTVTATVSATVEPTVPATIEPTQEASATSEPSATATSTPLPTLPADCVELIVNGGFETGAFPPEWAAEGDITLGPGRESGTGVLLGGRDNASGQLSQTVIVPESADPVRLEMWWLTEGDVPQVLDALDVYVNNGQGPYRLHTCRAVEPFDHWQQVELDLGAFAGKRIALAFLVGTDGEHPSVFRLDDVSLKACGVPALTATRTPSAVPSAGASPTATSDASSTPTTSAGTLPPTSTGTVPTPTTTLTAIPGTTVPPPVEPRLYIPFAQLD